MSDPERVPIRPSIRLGGRPASGEPLPADLFREALSHWASGVAVLAATDGEEIDAITISAFSALSVDPPLVLAAVGEQASVLPMVREEGRFVVSILAEGHRATASAIAQRLPGAYDAFAGLGDPAVTGALVALDCRLHAEHDGGDHRLLVGQIERVRLGDEAEPLIYYRRSYRSLG